MLWVIAESSKLKNTKVRRNLVGVRSLEDIGTLGRLGLEGLLCSCITTSFFSGLFTAWRAAERFYAESFGFLFDNTSLCRPCICISLPLIFAI